MKSCLKDYRSSVMGIAILWVMLFHTLFGTMGLFSFPKIIKLLQQTGFLGVDIFFFVSSYGLYYSMKKQYPLKIWYRNRIVRIIPSFIVIVIFTAILCRWNLWTFIMESTMVGFFCPLTNYTPLYWYIPACLLFYALFPFIYRNLSVISRWYLPLSACFFFITHVVGNVLSSSGLPTFIILLLNRVPIFLLGVIYAKNESLIINTKVSIKIVCLLVSFLLFSLMLLLVNSYIIDSRDCLLFILLISSLPFILRLCSVLSIIVGVRYILDYCGRYSLEIYLLHVSFQQVVVNSTIPTEYLYFAHCLPFLFAIVAACILHKIVSCVRNLLQL